MGDAILVINAGSSSIKFSLFIENGKDLELDTRGQVEGIYTEPHFIAKDSGGAVKAEKSWPKGFELGHAGAVEHLRGFLRSELADTANAAGGPRISTDASRVSAWVIPTNEELMIARHTRRVLHTVPEGVY
jgi:acetate kinase